MRNTKNNGPSINVCPKTLASRNSTNVSLNPYSAIQVKCTYTRNLKELHVHGSYSSHDATRFYFYFLIVKSWRDGSLRQSEIIIYSSHGKGYYQVIYFFLLYNHIERERESVTSSFLRFKLPPFVFSFHGEF